MCASAGSVLVAQTLDQVSVLDSIGQGAWQDFYSLAAAQGAKWVV